MIQIDYTFGGIDLSLMRIRQTWRDEMTNDFFFLGIYNTPCLDVWPHTSYIPFIWIFEYLEQTCCKHIRASLDGMTNSGDARHEVVIMYFFSLHFRFVISASSAGGLLFIYSYIMHLRADIFYIVHVFFFKALLCRIEVLRWSNFLGHLVEEIRVL